MQSGAHPLAIDAVVALISATVEHLNLPQSSDHVGKPDSYTGVQPHLKPREISVAELKLICAPV